MREIKFRTWDTAGKFFEYFDLHEIPHGCTTCPYEPQQYTGIKDKNGKDIYEGDILERLWAFGRERELLVVCFGLYENSCDENYGNGFYLSNLVGGRIEPMFFMEGCLLIGNISQNPELLK